MDVFLQFLLLAGIGICVWLAFHPSSREDYDDIETSRRLAPSGPDPRTGPLDLDFLATLPRRPVSEWRLPAQSRPAHDDVASTGTAGASQHESDRPAH